MPSDTRIKRRLLRATAQTALKAKGYQSIAICAGKGIAPGALLEAQKDAKKAKIAVRTSLSRKIQLDRLANGRWRTVNEVALVLVVVPALHDFDRAQVLAFRPEKLLSYVEQEIEARGRSESEGPVFVPIDGRRSSNSSLASLASWTLTLPLSQIDPAEHLDIKIERLIRELKSAIAAQDGVEEADVTLKILTSRYR